MLSVMNLPQELEELTDLLSTLPTKSVKGLFTKDIFYTALDVTEEYIAVGTSVGTVLLYERNNKTCRKLSTKVEY